MKPINFIIPNLNRRSDRFAECTRLLKVSNVPDHNIRRFTAHDHLDYNAYAEASVAIHNEFGELPAWLCEPLWNASKSNFCWNWTWYSILHTISMSNQHHFYVLLVDDIYLQIDYFRLRKLINTLYLPEKHHKFIVFLGHLHPSAEPCHDYVQHITEFQHGIPGKSDAATLYTTGGAHFMMQQANQLQNHVLRNQSPIILDPWILCVTLRQRIRREPNLQTGIFSCSDKLTLIDSDIPGVFTYYNSGLTDFTQNRDEIPRQT